MAIVTNKLIVLHCPRTGGKWIRAALTAGGVKWSEAGSSWHSVGPDVGWWRRRGRAVVTVARDVLSWYGSLWCFCVKTHWPVFPGHANVARADEFGDFIANVLDRCPGHYGRLIASYCDLADEILPLGSLGESLAELLAYHGERFNREQLLGVAPIDQAEPDLARRADLEGELGDRLLAVEADVLRGKPYAPLIFDGEISETDEENEDDGEQFDP